MICRVKRIARKNAVVNDKFRSPRTDLLLGEDPLVCITENKIKYNFDITKSMFCRGNITEKLRLAQEIKDTITDKFAVLLLYILALTVHPSLWGRGSGVCKSSKIIKRQSLIMNLVRFYATIYLIPIIPIILILPPIK